MAPIPRIYFFTRSKTIDSENQISGCRCRDNGCYNCIFSYSIFEYSIFVNPSNSISAQCYVRLWVVNRQWRFLVTLQWLITFRASAHERECTWRHYPTICNRFHLVPPIGDPTYYTFLERLPHGLSFEAIKSQHIKRINISAILTPHFQYLNYFSRNYRF